MDLVQDQSVRIGIQKRLPSRTNPPDSLTECTLLLYPDSILQIIDPWAVSGAYHQRLCRPDNSRISPPLLRPPPERKSEIMDVTAATQAKRKTQK